MKRPQHGGNLNWAATIAGCPVSALMDFSASINPLGMPQSAIAAIIKNTSNLQAYPDPSYSQLRSHLARHHQIDPAFILPGNGSAELLTWAGRELAQQNFTYLITPAFSDYTRALNTFEAQIIDCPLNLIVPSLPVPQSPHPNSGLLLNNPHNPTGKLWTREAILPYLDEFDLVVIDEAFMDFLTPSQEQSLIPMVEQYPNLVILRSLTKFYSMAGLRIGYAIAHPDRLQRWYGWRDPWSVNVLAEAATIAAIQDEEFQQRTWNWLESARSRLYDQLRAIPGLKPLKGATNYLLVKTETSATQLQEKLLTQHQIVIRDCMSFPELGDRYFRIAVRLPAENDRLIQAISAVLSSD
ncbi:threonine-phosphate decarboxylase [Waterburya agarophytonicola K14]|uniref:threonine-phosphate decarboxylase n=1 Tax=Waterburya agarophytonicola KI4 TaxID=2874699 RepID=A0A964BSF6_9CYAN|nr:threonine-phosphate decarboxylase CobD [Waterburya agarophytonicola]MCC0177377.1 threonine-phosphate decarboxylase [Waterburya agarophytonicola KI4]